MDNVNTVIRISENSEISQIMNRPCIFKAVDDIEENVNITHPANYALMGFFIAVCILVAIQSIKKFGFAAAVIDIILIGVLIFTYAKMLTAHKRIKNSKVVQDCPNTFYFYEDCYINTDRISRTCIRYEWAMQLRETKDAFLINIDGQSVHIIPKKAMKQGSAEELGQFLAARIKNVKR